MFTAPKRALPYPLDRASNLEVLTPEGGNPCGVPDFPEDSDEKITVLFRLSLNEFVALATAVDVGSDIAFGNDGIKVWYLWAASIMCAQFCEEVAECLNTENPAVVAALANLIRTNQTIINAISNSITNAGGGIPGQPISQQQSQSDILPENVRNEENECLPDELWGAVQYLIQSGNRAITDFFEVIEVASNTLERSEIVSQAIPAAGNYISAIAAFADQIGEELAEGYAGAFTEFYEQELMCDLFCMARTGCQLTPEMMIELMYTRLGEPFDIGDFGEIMAGVGAGTWVGDEIPDIMFLIYFSAINFGQQFGGQIGIRPLTVLMSLGADLLASDNWQVLCSCPECGIEYTLNIGTEGMEGDIISADTALVVRLDFPPLTAYARRIRVTFASPVTSVSMGWNTEGALDGMYASLDGSAAQSLAAPSGSTTLTFPAGTVLTIDLGYAGDSGAYAENPARINITNACN